MTPDDFDFLMREDFAPDIHATNFSTGTQLYGFTLDSRSFHVYVHGGHLHRFVYYKRDGHPTDIEYTHGRSFKPSQLVPDRWVSPERTSLVMGRLLREAGIEVPYAPYDMARYAAVQHQVFHGLVHTEGAQPFPGHTDELPVFPPEGTR
jgi:hypothetical protein